MCGTCSFPIWETLPTCIHCSTIQQPQYHLFDMFMLEVKFALQQRIVNCTDEVPHRCLYKII